VDLSSLAEVGKVAGVAGVAIGMIVLLVRPMIEGAKELPRSERAPMFRLIAIGSFTVGGLGILAWLIASVASLPGGAGGGNCNVSSGGIGAGGNKANCDFLPPAPAAKP
jgi:hypothetical protein